MNFIYEQRLSLSEQSTWTEANHAVQIHSLNMTKLLESSIDALRFQYENNNNTVGLRSEKRIPGITAVRKHSINTQPKRTE